MARSLFQRACGTAAGNLDIAFEDMGERQLKNIARTVRGVSPSAEGVAGGLIGGDPEQEFFADGIAGDIITALSRYEEGGKDGCLSRRPLRQR